MSRIFVLARTDPTVPKHKGTSFLLVELDQPGIEIRPLVDMAGGQHFCEVFFDGAITPADLIVGAPGDGWGIAMATLGFERGTAFIGQLRRYAAELNGVIEIARSRGLLDDPVVRQRLADTHVGLEIMRFGLYRTVTAVMRDGRPGAESSITKLQWSAWHQALGELATDLLGPDAALHRGQRGAARRRAQLPVRPRPHHLRRVVTGAAQHHRRAGARPPQGAGYSPVGPVKVGSRFSVWLANPSRASGPPKP